MRERILALVMAGGAGSRMDVLTADRAKPVLPFAGVYRLIDFPLSNCVHSGLSDVWVIEQYQPRSLNEHLANGRPWDLDRTYGGLHLLPPYQGGGEDGWHQGNADAIYHHRAAIRLFDPDLLLVLSADHVYTLDYRDVVRVHLDRRADVTMATARVAITEAGRFGTVLADDEGRVTGFEYKPDAPRTDRVTTEVFVYDARRLLTLIDDLARAGGGQADAGQRDGECRAGGEKASVGAGGADDEGAPALRDFGHELLPALVAGGRAYTFAMDGYWRDVGTIDSYWQGHMDLLADRPRPRLDDPRWPILTRGARRAPAWVDATARIERSLLSPGCSVRGTVVDSVLGPGVVVEAGATVRNAVLLGGCSVEAGATVACAILDEETRVGRDARAGAACAEGGPDEGWRCPADRIAVLGQGATIPAGGHVAPGEHVGPPTR